MHIWIHILRSYQYHPIWLIRSKIRWSVAIVTMFFIFTLLYQLAMVTKLLGSHMLALHVMWTILTIYVNLISIYENTIYLWPWGQGQGHWFDIECWKKSPNYYIWPCFNACKEEERGNCVHIRIHILRRHQYHPIWLFRGEIRWSVAIVNMFLIYILFHWLVKVLKSCLVLEFN